jgi:hypothetical protein
VFGDIADGSEEVGIKGGKEFDQKEKGKESVVYV